jgi:NAD(P)-dependent dehydrogenase (short-subunit alcohol dehydrogenase family)
METSLAGKVALVAGDCVQLGAAGATVYVTGRTSGSTRSEMNRPETTEETAALVDETGGSGIAVQVDHLVPNEVRALVARIEREQGGLHVLDQDRPDKVSRRKVCDVLPYSTGRAKTTRR